MRWSSGYSVSLTIFVLVVINTILSEKKYCANAITKIMMRMKLMFIPKNINIPMKAR
jgi:hypothetical protein